VSETIRQTEAGENEFGSKHPELQAEPLEIEEVWRLIDLEIGVPLGEAPLDYWMTEENERDLSGKRFHRFGEQALKEKF